MWKKIGFAALFILVVAVALIIQFHHPVQHYLAIQTGSMNTNGTPPNYNYWSGFGSVFPWELGLFVSVGAYLVAHYRLNNCHVEKCPRLAKYPVAAGHYKVCRKHHPEAHVRHSKVTFEHVQFAHALHLLRSGTGRLPDDKKDQK
jgi:hypothetical protein